MSKYISVQNLNKIYHGNQELWAFSLNDRNLIIDAQQSLVHQKMLLCMPVVRKYRPFCIPLTGQCLNK